jgi:hypothetical protein
MLLTVADEKRTHLHKERVLTVRTTNLPQNTIKSYQFSGVCILHRHLQELRAA